VLLTGFNRRFSPYARLLREQLRAASSPAMLVYRMNAGHLPADHWVHGAEGGGRNIGEACHVYDLFTYLADSKVRAVSAHSVAPRTGYYRADDNFSALLSFENGTLATLVYTAMGDPAAPKEALDAYFDGRILLLEDYRRLGEAAGASTLLETSVPDKGMRAELEAFHAAATGKTDWPIPLWQQLQACNMAFDVQRCLAGNAAP
jgi:predicted dehydrogenase